MAHPSQSDKNLMIQLQSIIPQRFMAYIITNIFYLFIY